MLSAAQGFAYNKFEKPNDWPKLKDTFDYDIRDGKLLGGNEHLYLSGPVTYTKVGNPTIVDGVLSNCSSSNHIKINSPLDYSKDLEIVFKLRLEDSFTQEGAILQDLKIIGGVSNGISITRSGKRRISLILSKGYSEGGTWNSLSYNQFPLEEWFYVKYIITSDNITLYTGSLLDSLTQVGTATRLGTTEGIDNPLIGYSYYWSTDQMFNEAQIDLKESYIKVNDQLWFYGKNYATQNIAPVPAGLEYNNTTTPEIGWVYTSNELVKGQVNYTKVGNPKIVDGVASGFSGSNVLSIGTAFPTGYSSFEQVVTFTTTNDLTQSFLIERLLMPGSRGGIDLNYSGSHLQLHAYFRTTEATGTDKGITVYSPYLSANTTYTGKFLWDGTTYTLELWQNDTKLGSNTLNNSNPLSIPSGTLFSIGGTQGSNDRYFHGSIDLKETYITVNGQAWFGNCPSEFQQFIAAPEGTMIGKDDTHSLAVETPIVNGELLSPKLVGPVGYTVVGSPTIVDGVVSGFSATNSLRISSSIDVTKPFEIFMKINTSDSNLLQNIVMLKGTSSVIAINATSHKPTFLMRYYGTDDLLHSTTATIQSGLENNTAYYLKGVFDTNGVSLSVSTDKTNWNTVTTPLPDDFVSWQVPSMVDLGGYDLYYFAGSIDLNETYIKVNGALWFGKEDWTPSTYTDNAIYLLGSHSTDYSTYNTQGINPTIETESDESGTYNVWIDNEEIYKEQSNPLDINWSNLALTTGYNITTPSTLKAHVIKVEPNNGNITRFSTTIEEDSDESI